MTAAVDSVELRRQVIETAQEMNRRGINVNKAGNVSARAVRGVVEGFLITPSGVPYESLEPVDIAFVPLDEPLSVERAVGPYAPSSEWEMHARIYRLRRDAAAVVHTHSCYATALACQDMSIPSFHYMVAAAGGSSIKVAPYRTFGTSALAQEAAEALRRVDACLLSHHGVLVLGNSLAKALTLAAEVENLAHQYVIVRTLGEPKLIDAEEMVRVIEKFRHYGQPHRTAGGCEGDGEQ